MSQATRARGLGRNLPPWVALTIWLLSTGYGAAPQGFVPPEVQSHRNRLREVNLELQLQANRNLAQASGDESQEIPKTFVDMTPAELAKAIPELKHLELAENQDLLPQILTRTGAKVARRCTCRTK